MLYFISGQGNISILIDDLIDYGCLLRPNSKERADCLSLQFNEHLSSFLFIYLRPNCWMSCE